MRYVALLALLWLIGLMTGAGFLVYAAYVLLAIVVLSRMLSDRWSEAIHVQRQLIASEIQVGEQVQIGVKVENRSRWFIPWMLIEDALPRRAVDWPPVALEVKGAALRLCWMAGNAHRLITYTLRAARRGYYQIGPTIAETGDLLGLHRQYRVTTHPDYLLVLPKIIPLAGYDIRSQRPVGEIRVTYRMLEDPTLISGIREYQQGDAFNRIHWRATARTGKLHTKVFQPTSVAGAMLVLDFHRDTNPDRHEPVRTDLAVTAAVSLAHALYLMQQPFGLVSNGRDAIDRIRTEGWESDHRSRQAAAASVAMSDTSDRLRPVILPAGRGAEQFQQMHHTLARLERTDGLSLAQLLIESQSRLPKSTSVVIILQEITEENAISIASLKRQGYAVTAIINQGEPELYQDIAGRLISYRIPSYHLTDEASIPILCRNWLT